MRLPNSIKLASIIFWSIIIIVFVVYPAYSVELSLGKTEQKPSGQVLVPIQLNTTKGDNPTCASLELQYNPNLITFQKIHIENSLIQLDKIVKTREIKPGLVRIIVYGLNKKSLPRGKIAIAYFRPKNLSLLKTTPLKINEAVGSTGEGTRLPIKSRSGQVNLNCPPLPIDILYNSKVSISLLLFIISNFFVLNHLKGQKAPLSFYSKIPGRRWVDWCTLKTRDRPPPFLTYLPPPLGVSGDLCVKPTKSNPSNPPVKTSSLSRNSILNSITKSLNKLIKFYIFVAFIFSLQWIILPQALSFAATYYVDANTINASDSNPGTISLPFKTIYKARDTIKGTSGNTIYIREGIYFLSETLSFDAQDSGSPGAPNIYMAYPGETPIIKGAMRVPVNEFTTYSGPILRADLSSYGIDDFSQVFLNGKRLHTARYPNYDPTDPIGGGFLYSSEYTTKSMIKFSPGQIDSSSWTNVNDIEINIFSGPNYWNSIVKLGSIDNSQATFLSNVSYSIVEGNRYYFQNIFEELDAVNEWYWNKYTKVLYVYPPKVLIENDMLTIPVVGNLIVVDAAAYIEFRGLRLEECRDKGFNVSGSRFIAIDNCTILNTKGVGITIHNGESITVNGCKIYETGHWAIYGYNTSDGGPYWSQLQSSNYVLSNNTIHDTGVWSKSGGGIYSKTVGATVSGNHIYDVPRIGIRFSGNENVIEYNYIHHVNRETNDSGAIYTVGRSWVKRGNVIRYNYIHDTGGYHIVGGVAKHPYNTHGIYLDDWASGNQVVYNTVKTSYFAGVMVHGGRDNRIEHNIIVEPINGAGVMFSEWPVTNAGYDTMWAELQDVLNSRNGWDGAKYLSQYPEIADIPAPDPPSRDYYFTGNTFRYNTLVWPSTRAREAYRISDINVATTIWDSNYLWPGSRTLEVRYNGSYIGLTAWQGYGFDLLAKDIEADMSPENFLLLVNTEKEEKSFSLGGQKYYDVNGDRVPDSVTLQPFESKILLYVESSFLYGDVNGDGYVNIQDVQCCINHISGTQDWGSAADVNWDGKADKLDVKEIIDILFRRIK